MNPIFIRILVFIFAFIIVVTLPWWISAIILVGLTIYFPLYLEVLFLGFLFDALYVIRNDFPYTGLTTALVLLLVILFARTRIRT